MVGVRWEPMTPMTDPEQLFTYLNFVAKEQTLLIRLLKGTKGQDEKSEEVAFVPNQYTVESLYAALRKKNQKGWNAFAQMGFITDTKEPQGNNVLWADMDDKGYPRGAEQIEEMIQALTVPPTMIVQSGHGKHLYWALDQAVHPEDARNLSKALQWQLGADAVHNPNRIMRIPGLANMKDPNNPKPVQIVHYDPAVVYDPGDMAERVDSILARLPHKIMKKLVIGPESGTDRSAYDFGLATTFMEYGLNDQQAKYLLMTYHGSGKAGEYDHREKTRYVERTVQQARHKVGTPVVDASTLAAPQFKLYTIEEMETLFQPNYVVEDLLPETGIMIIAAEPKARKSFFAMQMALAISTGTKFLGFDTQRPRSVLYVQAELAPYMVGERFRNMLGDKPRPVNVRIANIKAADLTQNPEWLIELVEREKFEVVIIDPIAKFISGDENSSISVGQLFSNLGRVQSLGASVILVHHSRKIPRGEQMSADKMRGSNRWFADVDSAVLLSKNEDDTEIHYELRAAKPRAGHPIYVWPNSTFHLRPYLTPEQKALYREAAKQEKELNAKEQGQPEADSGDHSDSKEAGLHA